LQKSLQTKAISALDSLVDFPGYPADWNSSTVKALGLAKNANILDESKITNLFALSYENVRSLLAAKPFDYYINIYCLSTYASSNFTNATCDTAPFPSYNSTTPAVFLKKTACPVSIYAGGTTTINISVRAAGFVNITHPIDVVLVMDRSGSMAGQKLTDAKKAAKGFVDKLNSTTDRTGVVSFTYGPSSCNSRDVGCYARIDQSLTSNTTRSKNAIDALTASGYTAIGEGIKNATAEFMRNSKNISRVMVLLSDGLNNRGADPIQQAYNASNNSIRIYTIGLGSDVNATAMKQIASITKGKYYFAPNSSDLEAIYSDIAKEFNDIAAKNLTIVDYLQPNVTVFGALPYECYSNQTSEKITYITCSISEDLNINETLSYAFNVTVSNPSVNSTNSNAYVTYLDYKNKSQTKYFDNPLLNVFPPTSYCAAYPLQHFGLTPPEIAEVVVSKRIALISSQPVFVEFGIWEEKV
jgi:uncharacterized protein YegL